MPLIKKTNAGVAAGATVYPLQGSQYEYLPFDALVEVAVLADAGDTFTGAIYSGSDVLLEAGSPVDNKAVTGAIVYPDDYTLQDVAAAGERLGIALTNAGGAAGDVRTAVRITPL